MSAIYTIKTHCMNEYFLSYLWLFRLYSGEMMLTDGRALSVENPGVLNTDSGPDFSGARVRIDNTLWIGNVEIHIRSSDWFVHGHQNDPAYDTVILHVVYQHDRDVVLSDNTILPVFTLEHRIDASLYTRYLQFMSSPGDIPCATLLKGNPPSVSEQWIISLGVQRMIRKGNELNYLLSRLKNDWQEILYVCFCRGFGNKVNDDVFEILALRTPFKLVRKYSSQVRSLEALLFGQSGLLPAPSSDIRHEYISELQDLYGHIRYKHELSEPVDAHLWRFMRTRPANFPTVRISQLAALLPGFSMINPMMPGEIKLWLDEATSIKVTEYWRCHYNFGKPCRSMPESIGRESVERIILNGIIPPLLRYGEIYKDHGFISDMIELANELAPEDNKITRKWHALELSAQSALETQGLTELFNEYCRQKRCLDCRFGHHLLAKTIG